MVCNKGAHFIFSLLANALAEPFMGNIYIDIDGLHQRGSCYIQSLLAYVLTEPSIGNIWVDVDGLQERGSCYIQKRAWASWSCPAEITSRHNGVQHLHEMTSKSQQQRLNVLSANDKLVLSSSGQIAAIHLKAIACWASDHSRPVKPVVKSIPVSVVQGCRSRKIYDYTTGPPIEDQVERKAIGLMVYLCLSVRKFCLYFELLCADVALIALQILLYNVTVVMGASSWVLCQSTIHSTILLWCQYVQCYHRSSMCCGVHAGGNIYDPPMN